VLISRDNVWTVRIDGETQDSVFTVHPSSFLFVPRRYPGRQCGGLAASETENRVTPITIVRCKGKRSYFVVRNRMPIIFAPFHAGLVLAANLDTCLLCLLRRGGIRGKTRLYCRSGKMKMRKKKKEDQSAEIKDDALWYRYSQSALIDPLGDDTVNPGFVQGIFNVLQILLKSKHPPGQFIIGHPHRRRKRSAGEGENMGTSRNGRARPTRKNSHLRLKHGDDQSRPVAHPNGGHLFQPRRLLRPRSRPRPRRSRRRHRRRDAHGREQPWRDASAGARLELRDLAAEPLHGRGHFCVRARVLLSRHGVGQRLLRAGREGGGRDRRTLFRRAAAASLRRLRRRFGLRVCVRDAVVASTATTTATTASSALLAVLWFGSVRAHVQSTRNSSRRRRGRERYWPRSECLGDGQA